ncbi:MAG: hypothetical protein IJL89_09195 [Firmicutes bacterium]|nr:hypothetical protein [Bacillota bacterium]
MCSLTKQEVRRIAREASLPSAAAPDSQELCFVSSEDTADFVKRNSENPLSRDIGKILDTDGNILGRHNGFYRYTVGQRKGLGISSDAPYYVKKTNPVKNEVIVCRENELYSDTVLCSDLAFMSVEDIPVGESVDASVKIRYRHAGQPARVIRRNSDSVLLRFDTPVRAPTPGQTAVFYDKDGCIIGCGNIADF